MADTCAADLPVKTSRSCKNVLVRSICSAALANLSALSRSPLLAHLAASRLRLLKIVDLPEARPPLRVTTRIPCVAQPWARRVRKGPSVAAAPGRKAWTNCARATMGQRLISIGGIVSSARCRRNGTTPLNEPDDVLAPGAQRQRDRDMRDLHEASVHGDRGGSTPPLLLSWDGGGRQAASPGEGLVAVH